MGTFLAFIVAAARLFMAQPWSKILLLCFAVFVGGCICGVKLTRGVVKAVTPDAPRPERTYPLRPWKNGETFIDEKTDIPNNPLKPLTVEEFEKLQNDLRKPKLPEAAKAVTAPVEPPKASATVCVGGNCARASAPKKTYSRRRLFGWR